MLYHYFLIKNLPLIEDINNIINAINFKLPRIINLMCYVDHPDLYYNIVNHIPQKNTNINFYLKNKRITTILFLNKNNIRKVDYQKSFIQSNNLKLYGPVDCYYHSTNGRKYKKMTNNGLKDGLYSCNELSLIHKCG